MEQRQISGGAEIQLAVEQTYEIGRNASFRVHIDKSSGRKEALVMDSFIYLGDSGSVHHLDQTSCLSCKF